MPFNNRKDEILGQRTEHFNVLNHTAAKALGYLASKNALEREITDLNQKQEKVGEDRKKIKKQKLSPEGARFYTNKYDQKSKEIADNLEEKETKLAKQLKEAPYEKLFFLQARVENYINKLTDNNTEERIKLLEAELDWGKGALSCQEIVDDMKEELATMKTKARDQETIDSYDHFIKQQLAAFGKLNEKLKAEIARIKTEKQKQQTKDVDEKEDKDKAKEESVNESLNPKTKENNSKNEEQTTIHVDGNRFKKLEFKLHGKSLEKEINEERIKVEERDNRKKSGSSERLIHAMIKKFGLTENEGQVEAATVWTLTKLVYPKEYIESKGNPYLAGTLIGNYAYKGTQVISEALNEKNLIIQVAELKASESGQKRNMMIYTVTPRGCKIKEALVTLDDQRYGINNLTFKELEPPEVITEELHQEQMTDEELTSSERKSETEIETEVETKEELEPSETTTEEESYQEQMTDEEEVEQLIMFKFDTGDEKLDGYFEDLADSELLGKNTKGPRVLKLLVKKFGYNVEPKKKEILKAISDYQQFLKQAG